MSRNNILILKDGKDSYFLRYIKGKNIKEYYKKMPSFIYHLLLKYKLYKFSVLFGSWKKELKDYDYIIMFDTHYNKEISRYIKKKNNNCKTILFYWNSINSNNEKFLDDKNIDEFWTFNKIDSQKYNLKYNTQFYTKEINISDNNIISDALFLGRAKKRKSDILKIENTLKNENIKTNFIIIENEKQVISYEDYIEMVCQTNSIVDIVDESQCGLTLRVMESIFLNKKLITNNKDIINYDFYNPKNIFIIGKDNISKLKEFIENSYEKIDSKIIKYYDFWSWMKRFET